jgi:SpoVK/Ycf46/Vps4 family AAA+-type ATPase
VSERKEIFKIHLEKRKRDAGSFALDKLAEITAGYSGSEIEEIIISALYDAFDCSEDIDDTKLLHTTGEMIPLSRTMEAEIKTIREWAKSRARKASISNFDDERDSSRKLEM